MKKLGLMLGVIVFLSVFSFAFVSADREDNQNGQDNSEGSGSPMLISAFNGSDERNNSNREMNRERINEMKDKIQELKDKIREHKGEFKMEGKKVNISELNDTQKEFIVGKINAKTGLNLSIDDLGNGTLGSIMSAYMSNGRKAEIRVMPDRASEIAREKFKIRCEEHNCTFELKEVGKGNESRAVYEMRAEKKSKLFGLFSKKMEIRSEIDAETGVAGKVHKPWWAFLASESDDSTDVSVNDSTNSS